MRVAFPAFLALLLIAGSAQAQVAGRANVLTSDSFDLGPNTYRLYGVDAVEFHQFCFVDGEPWACGASATRAFQVLLDPVIVTCEGTGEVTPSGEFATCTSEEGDIAEILVEQGWAFANPEQTDAYVAAEEAARAEGVGIWRGLVLPPWEYRQDIAAIEENMAERANASLEPAGQDSLLNNLDYVAVFDEFEVATDAEDGAEIEFAAPEIGAGFINRSIPDRGVFEWRQPAAALRNWRSGIVARMQAEATLAMMQSIGDSADTVVETADAGSYYLALTEQAAPLFEQGLQPILMIIGLPNPFWMADWFGEAPPQGAEITYRDDIEDPTYLGTIDGIDVYRTLAPGGESYLLAENALERVTFVEHDDGNIVSVERNADVDPAEVIVRFQIRPDWVDAPIANIRYPYEAGEGPYGS